LLVDSSWTKAFTLRLLFCEAGSEDGLGSDEGFGSAAGSLLGSGSEEGSVSGCGSGSSKNGKIEN